MKHITSLLKNSFLGNPERLEKYSTYIFLSPHLDDAILSCGNLIARLSSKGKKIIVITVFTGTSKVASPQATDFVKICGYTNAKKLFQIRKLEDINACKILGTHYVHLKYIDAAWRCFDNKPIYTSTEKQYSGKVSYRDSLLTNKIKREIDRLIVRYNNPVLFAPLGVGNHVDHLIVNKVAKKISIDKFFWEDFPYNRHGKNIIKFWISNKDYNFAFLSDNTFNHKKIKAVKQYKTQIKSILYGKLVFKREKYYITHDILN